MQVDPLHMRFGGYVMRLVNLQCLLGRRMLFNQPGKEPIIIVDWVRVVAVACDGSEGMTNSLQGPQKRSADGRSHVDGYGL